MALRAAPGTEISGVSTYFYSAAFLLKPLSDNGIIKSIQICQIGKDHWTHFFPPTHNP